MRVYSYAVLIFAMFPLSGWAAHPCEVAGRRIRQVRVTSTVQAGTITINLVAPPMSNVRFCDIDSGTFVPLNTPATADAKGVATANFTGPLGAGQEIQIQVQLMGSAPWQNAGNPIPVSAGAPSSGFQLLGRVREGVTAIPGVSDAKGATIEILDIGTGAPLGLTGGATSVTSDATTGSFTATLADPLYQGQVIRFLVAPAGLPPAQVLDLTVPGVAEWGRIHFDFSAGTVLSVDNSFQASTTSNNSTQSTIFMALNAEKNWKWAGIRISDGSGAHWTSRWMFNTYFQTRLTSVPVTTCQTSDSKCDNLTTFLNSAKSAELVGGAYVPIIVARWSWQNAPNSLTIAPLAKVGFITPTGSTPTNAVNQGKFYNFYAFGGRIGHFTHSADRNSAPELQNHIDVAIGRFSNLETLVPVFYNNQQLVAPNTTPLAPMTSPIRRWRVSIEGLMKVPATPLVLGFNANLGQNFFTPGLNYCGSAANCTPVPQPGIAATVSGAKDDLRFFIGTEFDVGKLMSKLPGF